MNSLKMAGELIHKDGNTFLRAGIHCLPIKADEHFEDGSWVMFDGVLNTGSFIKEDGKYGKTWIAVGKLSSNVLCAFANSFVADGVVVKIMPIRVTPLTKRRIVDFVVACGHNYYTCIAFGEKAKRLLSSKVVGSLISIKSATFQSRDYVKNEEPKTAYEIVVQAFE